MKQAGFEPTTLSFGDWCATVAPLLQCYQSILPLPIILNLSVFLIILINLRILVKIKSFLYLIYFYIKYVRLLDFQYFLNFPRLSLWRFPLFLLRCTFRPKFHKPKNKDFYFVEIENNVQLTYVSEILVQYFYE